MDAGSLSLYLWAIILNHNGTPHDDHLYKATTRNKTASQIHVLMYVSFDCRIIDHFKNKTTSHGQDGGLISEVPLH